MRKVLFADLDNTLIYSYRHDIGAEKRSVELYQGREISFMTQKTYKLLSGLSERMLFVPVTTRSAEQYGRIHLGIGDIRYALACNGGVLLADGRRDKEWYRRSLQIVEESREELGRAVRYLEQEAGRMLDVRFIQELFVFTKCSRPQSVLQGLKEELGLRFTDVFCNGEKVYAVPKKLNKGMAILRLQERIGAADVFAAGDSAFDIPMLQAAGFAAMPCGGIGSLSQGGHIYEMPGKAVFSEELLEFVLWHEKHGSAGGFFQNA